MRPVAALLPDITHACYLPHHGVWKGSGTAAKIRVVFNGSARTVSGVSLNDELLVGPNLLPLLCDGRGVALASGIASSSLPTSKRCTGR